MSLIFKTLAVLSFSIQLVNANITVNKLNYNWLTKNEVKAAKKKSYSRSKRKVASLVELTDSILSPELKQFRDKFLKIKTKEEMDVLITKLDKEYDSYPDDLKYFAAQIVPLSTFRSIMYKMYPVLSKEKATHSAIVTQVLNMASFMKINLPTSQWEAGFSYISEPFFADDKRFSTSTDIQVFVATVVYPELFKAAQRIQRLNFENVKIGWDNKLIYGTASFSDNFKRYRTISEGEKLLALSSLHYAMSWCTRFASYNISGSLNLAKDIAVLYGIDAAFSAKIDGVSANKIGSVYKKRKYRKLFTLTKSGAANLKIAYNHLKEATLIRAIAWKEFKTRNNNDTNLMTSSIINIAPLKTDNAIETLEQMVQKKVKLRSNITGELVAVDIPSFFLKPTQDLKKLLPTQFEGGDKTISKKIQDSRGRAKTVSYRNYFYGRAVNWDLNTYKTFLPEISKGSDVASAVRIVNQSSAGLLMSMGLNSLMLY